MVACGLDKRFDSVAEFRGNEDLRLGFAFLRGLGTVLGFGRNVGFAHFKVTVSRWQTMLSRRKVLSLTETAVSRVGVDIRISPLKYVDTKYAMSP